MPACMKSGRERQQRKPPIPPSLAVQPRQTTASSEWKAASKGNGDGPRITKGDPRSAHGAASGGTGHQPRSVWPVSPLEKWFSTLAHRTATREPPMLRAASTPQTGCSGQRCSLYTEPIHRAPTSFRRKSAPQDHIPVFQWELMRKGDFPKRQEHFLLKTGLAWHLSAKPRMLPV